MKQKVSFFVMALMIVGFTTSVNPVKSQDLTNVAWVKYAQATQGQLPLFKVMTFKKGNIQYLGGNFTDLNLFDTVKGSNVIQSISNLVNTLRISDGIGSNAGSASFTGVPMVNGLDFCAGLLYASSDQFPGLLVLNQSQKMEQVENLTINGSVYGFVPRGDSELLIYGAFADINGIKSVDIAAWNPLKNTVTPIVDYDGSLGLPQTPVDVSVGSDGTIGICFEDETDPQGYRLLEPGSYKFSTKSSDPRFPVGQPSSISVVDKNTVFIASVETQSRLFKWIKGGSWNEVLKTVYTGSSSSIRDLVYDTKNKLMFLTGGWQTVNGQQRNFQISFNSLTGETKNIAKESGEGLIELYIDPVSSQLYARSNITVGGGTIFALRDTERALPVTWLSFTGQQQGKSVLLKWATAHELNNDHFDVERSNDGRSFVKIGQVISSSGNNYSFEDFSPFSKGFYRLKQVDKDGRFDYSAVIQINSSILKKWNIYPNPCTDQTTLFINEGLRNISIQVISISGQVVKKLSFSVLNQGQKIPLNLGSFARGIYVINIYSDGGQKESQKIVVQ